MLQISDHASPSSSAGESRIIPLISDFPLSCTGRPSAGDVGRVWGCRGCGDFVGLERTWVFCGAEGDLRSFLGLEESRGSCGAVCQRTGMGDTSASPSWRKFWVPRDHHPHQPSHNLISGITSGYPVLKWRGFCPSKFQSGEEARELGRILLLQQCLDEIIR